MSQIALGVGEDVALAALDLLARVIAARAATFSRFHALAIDHAGTGRSFATSRFTSHQQQGMIEREPQFVIAPQVKPAPNRRDRRKAGRQHSPRQPPPQQIQDRLDEPSQRPFPRTAYGGGWRHEGETGRASGRERRRTYG